MKITWYTTNALKLSAGKDTLWIDPFTGYPLGQAGFSLAAFDKASSILITHGHLDHLSQVPALMDRKPRFVYGTPIVRKTLKRQGCDGQDIHVVRPFASLQIGDFQIRSYPGKHIHFDGELRRRTLAWSNLKRAWKSVLPLFLLHMHYPEKKETVCYEICHGDKTVFVLGSLDLDLKTSYPREMDLLILPYQGNTHLKEQAEKVLLRLEPKAVLVTHFDDSFPPISHAIDLEPLKELIRQEFPYTRLLIPVAGHILDLDKELRSDRNALPQEEGQVALKEELSEKEPALKTESSKETEAIPKETEAIQEDHSSSNSKETPQAEKEPEKESIEETDSPQTQVENPLLEEPVKEAEKPEEESENEPVPLLEESQPEDSSDQVRKQDQ